MNKKALEKILPGVEWQVPLKTETYFGLGGPARFFYRPKNEQELISVLLVAKKAKLKYLVLGGGSNVAISDRGWPGLVIKFEAKKPNKKDLQLVGRQLICPTNISLSFLVKFSIENSLAGLEKLAGIPGCVGGALVGNAGAYGVCLSDYLIWVDIFDGRQVRRLNKVNCHFGYRDSLFKKKNWVILRAGFLLPVGDSKVLKKVTREIIKIRQSKFSADWQCPGSFFKNVLVEKIPKKSLTKIDQSKIIGGKLPAGYLLEAVKARAEKSGHIIVSATHSNFFINTGGGKQSDVKKLANRLKAKVKKKFGIELVEEVRYIG